METKNQLKVVKTQHIVQDIMFSRQRLSVYEDKPWKQLARLLAEKR